MNNSISPSASPPDFKALLIEFDSSGQSIAGFARSKGFPLWKMYNALAQRSGKVRSRRSVARAVRNVAVRNVLLPVHVVDAQPAKQPAKLELLLGGGHRVLIGADFDVLTLRRLVEALSPC